ncbi:alanine racemase [Nigerium massiliense]|uniref:alanine racemase n=1 Tax=Nigerium massiliense TaxID=1522317 RepID=UPI00069432DE|nr:alanine racemase [Nigerium massiliense]
MIYPTVATTHLGNIRRNLEGVRRRVGDRAVLAAVKANGYGHGAVPVSRLIEREGLADWLGVATMPEALELRQAGIGLPILKLSQALGDEEIEAALRADVTLTVVDGPTIDQVAAAARRRRYEAAVHLKIDTGMRRIGAEPEDAAALALRCDEAGLTLGGVFSHLAVSDVPAGNDFTAEQVARFTRATEEIEAARGPVELRHLAASAGVLAHPEAWFDMVRPGIMIYGSYPDAQTEKTVRLRPGLSWTTVASFVKTVRAGETVGYGRTWTAERDTTIVTLPVGYGDGYSRLLSNRGRVLIGGRSCPIAGRVCMDQTMIDAGPDADVRVGDRVTLLGRDGDEEITALELAELMGTIPYEVTCLVAGRVSRRADD